VAYPNSGEPVPESQGCSAVNGVLLRRLVIVKQVLDAGATIRVLDFPSLDLTTPEGRGFLALFSAMAERGRMRIVKRTQQGRRLAIEAGKRMGASRS
jgi:DNA invertase Pin-like site-specific DNA recombinase